MQYLPYLVVDSGEGRGMCAAQMGRVHKTSQIRQADVVARCMLSYNYCKGKQ